jgi:hypothetical protein
MARKQHWFDFAPAVCRGRRRLAAVAAVAVGLVAAPAASAATLTYSAPNLTYTGVGTAESVTVESLSATSVKYFAMAQQQVTSMPSGCTQTNTVQQGQIVTCTLSGLDHLTFSLLGGDDTLIATGLSKATDISGGDGNDSITGGSLPDTVDGNAGNDTIKSGPGADTIASRDGVGETINCGNDVDTITGDSNDALTGCERQDLSSALVMDVDGDGYDRPADCDDNNPDIHPGAVDAPGDGIDQDCSGADAVAPASSSGSGSGSGTGTGSGSGAGTGSNSGAGTGAGAGVVAGTTTGNGGGAAVVVGTSTAASTGSAGVVGGSAVAQSASSSNASSSNSSSSGSTGGNKKPVFATITFKNRRKQRVTRATKVVVPLVPAGASVTITCTGKGCPKKPFAQTYASGAQHLVLRSVFAGRKLRAGAVVTLHLTQPGLIGRSVRYRINAQAAPDTQSACLADGTLAEIACPV